MWTSSGGGASDARKELLETRHRSFHTKDVANTQAGEAYARRGRRLGLVVLILATIVGTSAFASLKNDPSTAAKVAVAVLSFIAAAAAAVKEYAAYDDKAGEAAEAAKAFRALRYQADELLISLLGGAPEKEVADGISKLDADALKVDEPKLPRGYYKKAQKWVTDQERLTAGGATPVF